MSSPLSADFGLPASFPGSGARVRVPNDGGPYLASWFEGRKRVLAGRKPDLPDLVRVVTSHLLLSKCRQSFQAEGFPCPHPI